MSITMEYIDSETNTMRGKDIYFQELKGLCIILVVLIHLPFGWGSDGDIPLWIAVRKVINFPVATFFFLSAYFSYTYERLDGHLFEYYRKRIKRLLIPYSCWASLYIFLMPLLRTGEVPSNWLFLLLTGSGPTYFLLALLQFTVIHPFLQKYKSKAKWNVLFYSITFIYLAFYYSYNFHTGSEFKPEQFFCFPWFIFYYLGLKLQQKDCSRYKVDIIKYAGLIIAVLILSMIEAFAIYNKTGILSFAISQITIGSISYSIIFIFMVFMLKLNSGKASVLSKLGDYAMGIFLSQMLFIWIARVFLTKFLNYFVDTNATYMHVGFNILMLCVVIFMSYWFSKIISRYSPTLSKILGLK